MNNLFNTENKAKALNLLADTVSSTFGTIHQIGFEICKASEYGESKLIKRITGEQEQDTINKRRTETLATHAKMESYIAKIKAYNKVKPQSNNVVSTLTVQ